MKLVTTPLLAVLAGACAAPSDPGVLDVHATGDRHAIRTILTDHYFRGMDTLSFAAFEPAFHPDARLAFVAEGELVHLDLDQWRDRLASLRADADHPLNNEASVKHVGDLAVTGDAATAVVRFVFPSRTYTDFLHFVRVGGEWKIIAKTFQMELTP